MSHATREFLADLCDVSLVLRRCRRLAADKPVQDRVTLCTACGGEPFPTFLALLLLSIVRLEPALPRVHVACDGDPPRDFEGLPFVEFVPIRDSGRRGPRFWNYVAKSTSLRSARTPLACWIDSDVLLLRPLTPRLRGNAFIPMGGGRVGGGVYCLTRELVGPVVDAVLRWRDRLDTEDDRRCLRRALEELSVSYDALPALDVSLGDGEAWDESLEYPWLHLSAGKAARVAYLELWLRELDRLFHTPEPAPALPRFRPDRVGADQFCLARCRDFYLCGAPTGGPITVDLSPETGRFWVEWLSPGSGRLYPAGEVEGGRREIFSPLGAGGWLLVLRAAPSVTRLRFR